MIKPTMLLVVCLGIVGCASHPHPYDANYPDGNKDDDTAMGEPSDPCVNHNVPCKKDAFDNAADYARIGAHAAEDGSRWVYNETKKAWVYLNGPEVKVYMDELKIKFDAVADALKDYADDKPKKSDNKKTVEQ